ncbi:Retrovirus-related Pol polyprotein from transposon TNT 1-94 [Eumeta japonica]|uniref:Retrovirus-related Pol polyprotein from transposon TNT 1-94 n=1 Tax=Eumeta variegata TaxID=151549 RepID=A0A4C1Y5U6_EUMVA|nr:Retrovirus-related Pol polyprotein from transposon TNT 1-94 [Eumeta japonica]
MKVFGCEAMVHLPKKTQKWDPKAQKMIFIGYCENTKGYRFIIPNTRTVIKSRDAVFLESTVKRNYAALELSEKENKTLDIQCKSNEESLMSNQSNEENREETYNSDSSYNTTKNNSDSDEYLPDVKIDTPSPSNITLRPRNKNKEQTYLCYDECVVPEQVPDTYKEAISCENAEKWKKSIEEELEAHRRNGTWILVNKPENTNIIGSKWVFRVKDQPTGPRFKSRLCAKGYAQAKVSTIKKHFRLQSGMTQSVYYYL